ncbi:PPOX class F420-dependent oxidoreductase [Nocardia panacis]|uniref:PPOX class F420-dependent oxidoreductase n=1 Tax=Nocardia panacis TaxID=2340916 RepID=A0A3A4JYQ5_9NOCA|nr:PPOX class F420-dependent oxidoreductase [Nocardia panacis]RJO76445.1 PPOX class F420-dependent oxidoreductase [Nocardia panacis]
MTSLADERVRAFLMEGTRTGKVAVGLGDGRVRVTPVWFVVEGDEVVFNTGKESLKGRAFQRGGEVAMVVDVEALPYPSVQVIGTVTVSEDPDELVRTATALGGRYMGADRAEEFGKRNGVPGELVVRLRPTKVIAHFDAVGSGE